MSGSGGRVRPSLRVLGLAASWGDRHRREPQLSVEANILPGPALRPAGGCQGLASLSRSRQPGFDGPGRGGQTGEGPAVQRPRGTDRWCAECSAEHGGWWGRGKTAGGCRAPDFTLDVPQFLLDSSGELQPKPTKEPADTGPCDLGAVAAGLRSAPARPQAPGGY